MGEVEAFDILAFRHGPGIGHTTCWSLFMCTDVTLGQMQSAANLLATTWSLVF